MILSDTRNIVCPKCSNGSKRRARDEDGDHIITVYATAVVAAELSTYANGEQELLDAEQVDQGTKRWATCGECSHYWDLSPSVQFEAWPFIEATN